MGKTINHPFGEWFIPSVYGDSEGGLLLFLKHYQRKLGSNTSVLRTNRILRLEMMKGGARLPLDLEGWCAIET